MSTQNKGKVWLVGAGPSDAGLFTLKGKSLLEQADVIVYDKLVGQGIMAMIPSDTETISVGKIASHHTIPQDDINQILLEKAQKGKKVVRLKGGDPFLFGRGGEELELLCKNSIPFEIVPGVPSAISVPAYNGIPVTHRDYCSSVHIITGHTKKEEGADIDYEALTRLNGTLVFLMGVTSLEKICQGLLDAGMDSVMPAALLEKGTTAHQRRVISTIQNLPMDVKKAGLKSPAIIVVGQVCNLEKRFNWAETRPLGRLKIAVTRPKDRSSSLAEKLAYEGAEVVLLPTIKIKKILNNKSLQEALQNVYKYQWIVFSSTAGVDAFYETMEEIKMDIRELSGLKFAAIGLATKKAIETRGIFVDFVPKTYSGEALGEGLASLLSPKDHLLIPRANIGTDELLKPLVSARISFDDIPVYDTELVKIAGSEIYDNSIDYVAFTSASTVHGFVHANPQLEFENISSICIGEQTANAAKEYGMNVSIANESTLDSMVQCLVEKGAS